MPMKRLRHSDGRPLRMTPEQVARLYDVPPWLVSDHPRPRFPRVRWALRRVWPIR